MDGATGNAGAVGALTIIKNPISAAIAVMRHSQHVMLVGKGAEDFCREKGIELVDPPISIQKDVGNHCNKPFNMNKASNCRNPIY